MPLTSIDLPEEMLKKIDELKAQRLEQRSQQHRTLTITEQNEATKILRKSGLTEAQKYMDAILKPDGNGQLAVSRGGIIRECVAFALQITPSMPAVTLPMKPEAPSAKPKVVPKKF